MVKQNKIKVLGVMGEKRSEFLPDAPTFKEQGVDVIAATARGYSAPAGLPSGVEAKLEAALKKAIEDPTVTAKMKSFGLQTNYLSGTDYKKFWGDQETTVKAVLPDVMGK
jgi:tripartite-type tricarboxylate transporter receptor subunit TctC